MWCFYCLQAFKEMLYAAQDQAPSIEGMHAHTVTYGLTGNHIDFLCLSPSLVLLIRAAAVFALCWKLLCYHFGVRPRVLHVYISATAEHPNPTIPKY